MAGSLIACASRRHVFGVKANVKSAVGFVDEATVVYPAGHHLVKYTLETRLQEFINGSEASLGVTAVAVSQTRRLVAVAEEGTESGVVYIYNLRRLYRLKTLSTPEVLSPRYVSLGFSSDDALLLTLGGAPDWKLVCWQVEKGKMLAAIQVSVSPELVMYSCSFNPANPTKIAVNGNGVFKFLSLEEDEKMAVIPNSAAFNERTPQDYLAHAWLDDDFSVLGTAAGDLLLFRREVLLTVLPSSPSDGVPIDVIVPYGRGFLTGGDGGIVRLFTPTDEEGVFFVNTKSFTIGPTAVPDGSRRIHSMALTPSQERLGVMTCGAQMLQLDLGKAVVKEETPFTVLASPSHGPVVDGAVGPGDPSHVCAVTGLDVCVRKPLVVTSGVDNWVRVWNYAEKRLEHAENMGEAVTSVAIHPSGFHLLVGCPDKLKVLNVLLDELKVVKSLSVKACRECRFSHGGHLFAAANANLVQVYSTFTCQMVQTLRGHSGRVQSIAWSLDDDLLITAGLDGAVYAWNWRTGKRVRDFVNKSVQYTAASATKDSAVVYAVGSDCKLLEVDMINASVLKEVAHDDVLGQVVLASNGRMLFSGVSSEGRVGSVLSYAMPIASGECTPYPCVSGPVTRMMLSYDDSHLVVAGADGCIAILEVRDRDGRVPMRDAASRLPWSDEVLMTRSLLEDMARQIQELSEQYDELVSNNEYNMRMREMAYQDEIKKITERYQAELDQQKTQFSLLREETEDLQREFGERLAAMEVAHRSEMQKRENLYQRSIMDEVQKYQELAAEVDRTAEEQRSRRTAQITAHEDRIAKLTGDMEHRLADARKKRTDLETVNAGLLRDWEEREVQMEEDLDDEVEEMKRQYESKLEQEKQQILKAKSDAGVQRKRYQALKQDIDDQEEQLGQLEEVRRQDELDIAAAKKRLEVLVQQTKESDAKIRDREKQIYELKKKNQELEKFKFVLDYQIKELKRQIEPRETEIQAMRKQIKEVDSELEAYHRVNADLDHKIGELREELDRLQAIVARSRATLHQRSTAMDRYKSDLHAVASHILDPEKLRHAISDLYKRHVPTDLDVPRVERTITDEFHRQEEYLAESVDALKKKLMTDQEANRAGVLQLMEDNMRIIGEISSLRGTVTRLRAARQARSMGTTAAPASATSAAAAAAAAAVGASGGGGGASATSSSASAAALGIRVGSEDVERMLKVMDARRDEIGTLREDIVRLETALATAKPITRLTPRET